MATINTRRSPNHTALTVTKHYRTVLRYVELDRVIFTQRYFATQNTCGITAQECLLLTGYWCRSQWPRGLRRSSLAARLLRLWVRIPPEAWIFVCCECCVLSGRGLCDGLIIRSEESYQIWRVVVCDQETSQARRLKPTRWAVKYNPHKYNPQWGL